MSKRFLPSCVLVVSFFISGMNNNACGTETIYYPKSTAKIDPHIDYVLEVLTAALQIFPGKYQPTPSNISYPQTRAINETISPSGDIDLVWTMSTNERESKLIPVRIPLDKGMLGWRISFVSSKNKEVLKPVKSRNDLKKFDAGQVHDWPDTDILQSNKLNVVTSSTYEALFKMLEVNRFDYFPRAIFEIWGEQASHSDMRIAIDDHNADPVSPSISKMAWNIFWLTANLKASFKNIIKNRYIKPISDTEPS